MDLADHIRDVPDFPKPGVLFKDITPLLQHPAALKEAVSAMCDPFRAAGVEAVAGAESRGFIFGTAMALELGCGFVPIRKPNKLPHDKHTIAYGLEYGTDTLEIHLDAIQPGERVLMADDLLATGGTMKACCDLVEKLGADVVGISVLIELTFLDGRAKLNGHGDVHAVVTY